MVAVLETQYSAGQIRGVKIRGVKTLTEYKAKNKREQTSVCTVYIFFKKGAILLYFNFKLFSALVRRACENIEVKCGQYFGKTSAYLYSLEDTLSIFEYYFRKYEDTFGEVHPNICMKQIEKIVLLMPSIDSTDYGNQISDIDPDAYPVMIDKHFRTQYRGCDYNINHFFSGDIRLMRFYEELY